MEDSSGDFAWCFLRPSRTPLPRDHRRLSRVGSHAPTLPQRCLSAACLAVHGVTQSLSRATACSAQENNMMEPCVRRRRWQSAREASMKLLRDQDGIALETLAAVIAHSQIVLAQPAGFAARS